MVLICISFVHVSILDIWLILIGLLTFGAANCQDNKNKLIWKSLQVKVNLR